MSNHNSSNGRDPWRGFATDQTREQDRKEQPFHNPQIHDGFHPVATWSHDIDNQSVATYYMRQFMSMPFTVTGWIRTLVAFPLIGAIVKHTVWQSIIWMNWYAFIPGCLIVLPLLAGLFLSLRIKDIRYPALLKYSLMLLGSLL